MTEFEALGEDFLNQQAEIDALALRGGHDEETITTLFRRLHGGPSKVRGGDLTSLRDHLVMVHAPLVEHCARNFLASGEPLDDLVQEGYVGLIKAVDRFDPDKGNKFSTYACHLISGEIRHYLRDLGRLIHEPGWHFELRNKINRATDHLTIQLGKAPSPEEIAGHLSVKVETVREVLSRAQTLTVESLEARNERDESEGRLSVLERHDPRAGTLARGEEARVEDSLFLDFAMPQLKELEQQALTLFFFEEHSKTEIARQLGISINYVSYLIKRGTEALRRLLETSDVLPVAMGASVYSQQQARAAYLLEIAKTAGISDARRQFSPSARVPALAKPSVSSLAQFASWLDEEVARVGRYGGEFSVLWFQLRNWSALTREMPIGQRKNCAAAASALVRRKCRNVDKVAALESADPPGLHFLVLLPATGEQGKALGNRLVEAFTKPDLPGVSAPIHTRVAYAMCPDDARITDELFEFLGAKLAA